ncbi:sensor histidine kinase [Stratiformator vulcanicus]|uniref:histidine kinase n=1 Tax=Stratiformator vulcanicus TaxID=2527980 RepID=A0A517QY08_9PLAN|nr:ATP-binding protein [Stratiformator vulcanicus]QDT36478.1 Wide host range VirA protein [Stratiformator vulcanicus]
MADGTAHEAPASIESLRAENQRLRDELARAQRLSTVGSIAASITHEFNNILTTTINYAKMGLRNEDPATREKAFTKILSAGQRASKITTGMLSYARGGRDQKEPTDLAELLGDVLVLVEKDLKCHRISVEIDAAENVIAEISASQVQQVILNMVINARQAMTAGGTLRLTVRRDVSTGFAELAVADSGSGIPADKLPHIFDSFYSTKERDAQGQGGTGLGLAFCKEVVQAHGGRIRVESTIDRGTTFTLKFPLAEKASLAAAG